MDTFSSEYSRDIEPVKGLFNDNSCYQVVQNTRDYRDLAPWVVFRQSPIDMAGVRSRRDNLVPEYRDCIGDTAHRGHMSYMGQLHYVEYLRHENTNIRLSAWNSFLKFP